MTTSIVLPPPHAAIVALLGGIISCATCVVTAAQPPVVDAAMRAAVDEDWGLQEARRGRTIEDPTSVRAAWDSAKRLLDALATHPSMPSLDVERQALADLSVGLDSLESFNSVERAERYRSIRQVTRSLVPKHPLLAGRPLLFMKRRRFICQMLHEYIGYYYNYDGLWGGGLYVLDEPGKSMKTRSLLEGKLPPGNFATPALSQDGRTAYFAYCRRTTVPRDHESTGHYHGFPAARDVSAELNYYGPNRACFSIYSLDLTTGQLQQLTDDCEDDFNPCPLADGRVIFMSSRRGGFCRCDNPFEPIPTATLHSMNSDGSECRPLSFHETNEWHPALLNDGRVVYCRWDYVDRSAAHFHGLWTSNPDGSNPVALFGNYTKNISACFQPRAIPGSRRIAFIAGAHHANVGGSLVLFDPARAKLNEESGEDDFDSLEVITPEVGFPEAPDHWPGSFFHSPWPLSEDYYLVAFSFEPLPGMGSGVVSDSRTGLYYLDRFGNLELLYRDTDISAMHPIPLAPQRPTHRIPTTLDRTLGDEGEFLLADVNWSLKPLPANRRVTALRVFQVLPKSETHIANQPRIGHANAEAARAFLGTVPVEEDGSAYFRAPARVPLYFQAIDEGGRAVQSMRSVTYLQPGERRGCVGCHERSGATPPMQAGIAFRRAPSALQPGPAGSRPFSYAQLVQPVLDRHCVKCHDGTEGEDKSEWRLTGEPFERFSHSYASLRGFVRWYEWGGETIRPTVTFPGRIGADASPLLGRLNSTHHPPVTLSDEDRRRLYLWLDANAPFYGTYEAEQQQAQQRGKQVAMPRLQ
jgi:hypothetical protein